MNNPEFSFNHVPLEQNLDEINKLNPKKGSHQTTGILVLIIKRTKYVLYLS